jgi:hypothetical protein
MSLANLTFFRFYIHLSHPFYICKHNLQAAIDKEDCGPMAGLYDLSKLWIAYYAIRCKQQGKDVKKTKLQWPIFIFMS